MADFDPIPAESAVEEAQQRWKERTDTFGRVYYTILGITEFTHYPEVANTANCSENSAKKHLNRLVEMGLVERDSRVKLARYRRNDAYFEWRNASRIAGDLTKDEIIERVDQLESRKAEFEDQFESDDPSTISLVDQSNDQSVHDRLKAISEWQSTEREIQIYELAYHLASNDGHLIPV